MRHFKLVALTWREWALEEFMAGRARFGWSFFPGADLRILEEKISNWEDGKSKWTDQEGVVWRHCQFLVRRIQPGDRIVVQFEKPMEQFVIGEVTEPGYDFAEDGCLWEDGKTLDFRHVLNVRPLTPTPIPLDSAEVTAALQHDLTKRGHYYEIYPERSIRALMHLVNRVDKGELDIRKKRSEALTLERTEKAVLHRTIQEISDQWPGKNFERFVVHLCNHLPHVEVKSHQDTKRGWDLLVAVRNPLTGEVLQDDIPIQCKNHTGDVTVSRPIEDLERSVKNSRSDVAILFILGDIGDEFQRKLEIKAQELRRREKREIKFEVVDQERIAELYLSYLVSQQTSGSS